MSHKGRKRVTRGAGGDGGGREVEEAAEEEEEEARRMGPNMGRIAKSRSGFESWGCRDVDERQSAWAAQ